jgi:glycerate kinase
VHVVAAPDKFRGTAPASEVARAVAAAAQRAGWTCDEAPVADGGEGTLDAFGGANRMTVVSGPLGDPVEAPWLRRGGLAVIEMAKASGLDLVGGAEQNDPIAASTYGTGELIAVAVEGGARRVIVGLGGSATTDGGLGALRALEPLHRMKGVDIVAACDVETLFLDAARVFAPQKGASDAQVSLLHRRLERLAQMYAEEYGVDVGGLPGSGAAGGLGGGLVVAGAELIPGFEVVADELGLAERIEVADLVVTGEGFLDEESFRGKAVGGVVGLAAAVGVPVLAVVGDAVERLEIPKGWTLDIVSLVDRFGDERARSATLELVTEVCADHLVPS